MRENPLIYLDNCATTTVCEPAVQAVLAAMTDNYGNPSSLHKMGLEAEKLLDRCRETIANVLGAKPGEIIFTSGATESNNLVLYGVHNACLRQKGSIVTLQTEHASVLSPLDDIEQKDRRVIRVAPAGNIEDALANAVDDTTLLAAFAPVNNETGMTVDIKQAIAKIKRKNPRTLIHIDGAQSFCKIDLNDTGADFISISGHKTGAPKGIGALFIRNKVRLTPLMRGGGQENAKRPGTQSVPLISGMDAAVSYHFPLIHKHTAHYQALNKYLRAALSSIPGLLINSPENGAPYILNFSTNKIPGEVMLHYLEQFGIFVSSGSACSRGALSHVLKAAGLDKTRISTALRVSFSPVTTTNELDHFINRLKEGMEKL